MPSSWKRFKRERQRRQKTDAAIQAEKSATLSGNERLKGAQPGEKHFLLRRNIHRLEKGLSMPERKPHFAQAFIEETAEIFVAMARDDPGNSVFVWAQDVLATYFSVVHEGDARIDAARKLWQSAQLTDMSEGTKVPYTANRLQERVSDKLDQGFDYEAFHLLCQTRRSHRWFEPEPVDMADIRAAMASALQAPSACNRQPFDFYVTQDPARIVEIAAMPLGTKGFGDELPCLIAVIGNLSAFTEPRDRHLIFTDAGLAVMQFMLALTARGLASVPINWPDMPEIHEQLRGVLALAPYQVPVMLIGVGKPRDAGMIPYSEKRHVDEVLHEV